MPTAVTGTSGATIDETTTVPDDGDPANGGSLVTAFQVVMNAIKRLKEWRGAASGVAPLDGSSKVPVANLRGVQLSYYVDDQAHQVTITNTATNYVYTYQVPLTGAAAGDIVHWTMTGVVGLNRSAGVASALVAFLARQGDAATETGTHTISNDTNADYNAALPFALSGSFAVTSADVLSGVATVVLVANRSGATSALSIIRACHFTARVVRP